jgi:transcriptional regulator with XRE-family HTH domain
MIESSEFTRSIGLEIAKQRKLKNFSQEELGYKAGLHRTYISLIERGIKSPTLDSLYKIAIALDLPIYIICEAAEKSVNKDFKVE